MNIKVYVFLGCTAVSSCGGRSATNVGTGAGGGSVVCGPGTVQVRDECLPSSGVTSDADASNDGLITGAFGADASTGRGSSVEAGEDAPISFTGSDGGSTSGFAIDQAHDNAESTAVVRSPLTQAWMVEFQGPVSYPLVLGTTAIVATSASQASIEAVDLATGTTVWGPLGFGDPVQLAADGNTVVALDQNGVLTAIDGTTGKQMWSTQLVTQSEFDAPPVAVGGLVYVNGLGSGGTTYAVDEKTGATVWSADTVAGSFGAVGVAGGVVYEAEACDQVSAFDALTGVLRWYHSTSCEGGGGAAPAIYQGLVWVRDWALGDIILDTSGAVHGSFVATNVPSFFGGSAFLQSMGTLTAVDAQTKLKQWSFNGDSQLCTSAIVAGGGAQVFVGSQTGNVYELDATTGTQISVSNTGNPVTCGSETQSIALGGGHLLVPAGNSLVAY